MYVLGAPQADSGFTSTAGVNTLGELRGNVVTPATFGTNQNDYAGCTSAALICRLGPTANVDLTGFTGGAAGRVLIVQNVDATGFQLTFRNQSTSSTTAADRLQLPDGVDSWPLQQYGTAVFTYDGTTSRWLLTSWSNDVIPKMTVTTAFTVDRNGASATIGSSGLTDNGTTVNAPLTVKVIDHLKLVWTGTTRAEFYSGATKVCDINTNIPSGSTRLTGAGFGIRKTTGTTTRNMDTDYTRLSVDLTAARSP
jgi:hypothetical protein